MRASVLRCEQSCLSDILVSLLFTSRWISFRHVNFAIDLDSNENELSMDGLLYYWESKCIYVLYLGVSLQFELTGMWWERKKYKKLVKTVNTYFPCIPACKQTQLNQCNNSWMKTSNNISQLFIWRWINKYVYLCLYSVYSRRRHIQYSKSQLSSQNENYIITQDCLYRLNKIIKRNTFVFAPIFNELNFHEILCTQKAYFSQILFTNLSKLC